MSRVLSNAGLSDELWHVAPIPMKDVTWAGKNPLTLGFAFGSEDGTVLFTDEDFVKGGGFAPEEAQPFQIVESGEAVNGIAGVGRSVVVTSRADITVCVETTPGKWSRCVLDMGAHGVEVLPSGNFVAALGRHGLLWIKAGSKENAEADLMRPAGGGVFYCVRAHSAKNGADLLACATRGMGLGIGHVQWEKEEFNIGHRMRIGLDVVDVCFIEREGKAPGVVALGSDGSLTIVADAEMAENGTPITMTVGEIVGKGYRVLASRGHLFVLTSRGLFGLLGLADLLATGVVPEKMRQRVFCVEMKAVDVNLVHDRWLLVVMPDQVRVLDVAKMGAAISGAQSAGQLIEGMPSISAIELDAMSEVLLAAG